LAHLFTEKDSQAIYDTIKAIASEEKLRISGSSATSQRKAVVIHA
jgi:hypothetical protein